MLKNNLRRYQSGFTLVETMVSVAIMTLVVLGVLQILGMQLKVSNTARIDADVSNTVFLINAVLKNSNACKDNINNFGSKKVTLPVSATEKLAVPAIDYPMGGGKLISVGGAASSKAATLKDMFLTNFKLLSSSGGYNIVSSELNLQFEKPQAVGAQVTNRKIAVQLRADASGTIVDCSGEGTELTPFQMQAMCIASDGTFDFATKKCSLPKPIIPPPQTIVMQMPVPVPVAAASAPSTGGPAPASASGPAIASTLPPVASAAPPVQAPRPAYIPPAPEPAVIAAVAPPVPQPAPYIPPPAVVAAPRPPSIFQCPVIGVQAGTSAVDSLIDFVCSSNCLGQLSSNSSCTITRAHEGRCNDAGLVYENVSCSPLY